jgi:putative transposase
MLNVIVSILMKVAPKLLHYFKGFSFPSDIILTATYMKCRFALSYRDIEELCEMRGIKLDHATVQRWMIRFIPLLDKRFRLRKKSVSDSWRMDETYIKVSGKWKYLYRAVDKYGYTIDFLLRAKRDKVAAKAFFRKAIQQNGKPVEVNIDKSGSNTYALADLNSEYEENKEAEIEIRQNKYLNNLIEGDHRFIKRIVRPMLGFKSFASARITIAGIETVNMIRKNQLNTTTNNQSNYDQFTSLIAA